MQSLQHTLPQTSKISSVDEMIQFGSSIARAGYKKVLLYGDLGAGKTHFTKGFVAGLGGDPTTVQSPTYTYVHAYPLNLGEICHFDLYRLEDEQSFINKGLLTMMDEYEYIIIERPKFEHLYTDATRVKVDIKKTGENEREVITGKQRLCMTLS